MPLIGMRDIANADRLHGDRCCCPVECAGITLRGSTLSMVDGDAEDAAEDDADEMGDPVDSDDEADDGDAVADDGKDGCGCATTVIDPARLAWTLPLFGLLGLRRRSRA